MKRSGWLFIMIICISSLMVGCGKNIKTEHIDAGMKLVEALDYNGALESFNQAILNGENSELALRGQGLAYLGLTQYEDAKKSFLDALTYSKGATELEYDINYYLATAYYKTGDLQGTIDTYTAIIDLKPKEKNAYYLRGTVKIEKGDYKGGITDFEKSMKLGKKDYDLLTNIAICLEKYGHSEDAQSYLTAALKENKGMSNYNKGRINYYLKKYDDARNALEEARSTETSNISEIVIMLGKTYEALGDYNYASSVYSDFLKDNTDREDVYNQLGMCKMQLGYAKEKEGNKADAAVYFQAALDTFQTAIKIPNNQKTQILKYNEIVAYEYLGEYKNAAVLMEKYIATYPDDGAAKREYEFLQNR